MRIVERIWYGDGVGPGLARAALLPVSMLYGVGVAVRNALFDHRILVAHETAIPVVSVGNLTVGGTGKTPVAAALARTCVERGAHPAIVLRGYGGDEAAVLRRLAPGAIVIEASDRVRGVAQAASDGCDVALLDDGMQHRRVAREADIVVVSADRHEKRARLLPMGPWREPMSSLRRASYVLVTRKAASRDVAESVLATSLAAAGCGAGGIAALSLDAIENAAGERADLAQLATERVVAFSGIGDAHAFELQVRGCAPNADVLAFPDHHAFSASDVSQIVEHAEGAARVVCTLKDFAKVIDKWPRQAPPVWYFSQRVDIEHGRDALEDLLQHVLDHRRLTTPIAAGKGRRF